MEITVQEAKGVVDLINGVMEDIDGLSTTYVLYFVYCDQTIQFKLLDCVLCDTSEVDDLDGESCWTDYIYKLVQDEVDLIADNLLLQAKALVSYPRTGNMEKGQ
jgi:hypothetical protein